MGDSGRRRATWRLTGRARGRLQAAVVLVVCLLLYFIVFRPYFNGLVQTRDFQTCQTNNLKLARAIGIYLREWDDAYPPASDWMSNLGGNMAATSNTGFSVLTYFHCPTDKSGSRTSYAYNEVMGGFNPGLKPKSEAEKSLRKEIGRLARAPLIIEKHGGGDNAHVRLLTWDDVRREMTLPHLIPEPTGLLINGSQSLERITSEYLQNSADRNF